MAVVTELIVGRNGLVRAAVVRSTNGHTTRPITKLYPMEMNEADEKTLGMEKSYLTATDPDITSINPDTSRDKHSHPQRSSTTKATD